MALILISAPSKKHFLRFLKTLPKGFRKTMFPENHYYKYWHKVILGLGRKKSDSYCLTQSYGFIFQAHELLGDELVFLRIEDDMEVIRYETDVLHTALTYNLEIR